LSRNRAHNTLTTEERIAEEMKKYSFKATPYDKKRASVRFVSGIPKITTSKKPTKPKEFTFNTESRVELRKRLYPGHGSVPAPLKATFIPKK
jgi:hypothetical protein